MIAFFQIILLPIAVISTISAAFFLWGVITLLTAKRNPIKVAKGNKILIWTVSGFFIALIGISIFFFISNSLGGGNAFQSQVIQINTDEFPPAPPVDQIPPAPR